MDLLNIFKLFVLGLVTYLAHQHNGYIPPGQYWYCAIQMVFLFSSFLCSTLLIVSMTFDRFYSIIRPHKAASFNTIKRAKVFIISPVIFCFIFNLPHLFLSSHENWQCLPYGQATEVSYGLFYYWLSLVVNYALPFVLLLSMNSVVIHKIRNRGIVTNSPECGNHLQSMIQDKKFKSKNSENQMCLILLMVSFGFLILTTPAYLLFFFIMFVDFLKTPQLFAGYYLLWNVSHKLYTTNHGINFFLYVISGRKFRTDLLKLFKRSNHKGNLDSHSTDIMTVTWRKAGIWVSQIFPKLTQIHNNGKHSPRIVESVDTSPKSLWR